MPTYAGRLTAGPLPPSTSVTVVDPTGGPNGNTPADATLYATRTYTGSVSNPITTTSEGELPEVYVEPGSYMLVFGGESRSAEAKLDAAEDDATEFATVAELAEAGASQGAGLPTVRAFPFTFDTPDILTGVEVWTPAVGDLLLDAWVDVETAWDGTTPFCDINVSGAWGLFDNYLPVATPMDTAGQQVTLSQAAALLAVKFMLLVPAIESVPSGNQSLIYPNPTPWAGSGVFRFATTDPLKVWVSQDGSSTGADPGATQGAATLYIVTATPA